MPNKQGLTHHQIFVEAFGEKAGLPVCTGQLKFRGRPFYGDCLWDRYQCEACGALIDTPRIGHWWTQEVKLAS